MTDTLPITEGRYDQLVDRIAKMLRQAADAERRGEDDERIAYQEKAFLMMAMYGVEEATARQRAGQMDTKSRDAETTHIYIRFEGKYKPMQAIVLHQIARAMHCDTFQTGTKGRIAMKVYGMPDHLQRLQTLWELLVPQALHGMAHAEPPDGYYHSGELRIYRRSWLAGFANEIESRIYKAENIAAESVGALVLYESDLEHATVAMHDDNPNCRVLYSRRRQSSSGYQQGAQAGRNASLHRSLKES